MSVSISSDSLPASDDLQYGPRERLLQIGESRLSDAECLALLLRTGKRGESAEVMAQRLLLRFGSLALLAAAPVREIAHEKGIGLVRAAAIGGAFGLARRVLEARLRPGRTLHRGADVAAVVRESVRGSRRETFFALLLDIRHRILSLRVISTGSLEQAPVHPREVFSPAVREGAAAIVVAHNHPSGDPTPSSEDRAVTDRLRQAGELLGIQLLDHVVVGEERAYSFAESAFVPLT
ncbi:MAG: DNA repair protein RadC [Planctomycetota bacterium]|nr:DNA repair protein RadC [Planctomycetota bacterium]MSR37240.1 JAB domain-containing protein [Planctomycetota bacterium]